MNCKNCGEILTGNYCSHCGQKSNVSQITLSKLLNDLTESIFQFNSGFFYTVKVLFLRPGQSIQDFLDGKRKNHFKPVAYVLLFSTIYFLASEFTNQDTWIDNFISGFSEGGKYSNDEVEMQDMVSWFANNYAYTTLLLVPFFSFASYLCFPKSKANYLEHVVLNCYITGQQAILYTTFMLVQVVVKNDEVSSIAAILSILYCFWVLWQFFDEGNRIVNVLRSISTYLVYSLFSSIAFLLVLIVQELI